MGQRTQNRFREHNLVATDRMSTEVFGAEGRLMRLWMCIDDDCSWKGWLDEPQRDVCVNTLDRD